MDKPTHPLRPAVRSHRRLGHDEWFDMLLAKEPRWSPEPTAPRAPHVVLREGYSGDARIVVAVADLRGLRDCDETSLAETVSGPLYEALLRGLEVDGVLLVQTGGGLNAQAHLARLLDQPRIGGAKDLLADYGKPFIVLAADPTASCIDAGLLLAADVIVADADARGGLRLLAPAGDMTDLGANDLTSLVDQVVERSRLSGVIAQIFAAFTAPATAHTRTPDATPVRMA